MNPVLKDIAPSIIRELHSRKHADSIDLGLGEPTLRPEMAPFEAATQWVAEHGCPYSPNPGFSELRGAIARHYAYPGLDQAANVCVTVGSQEALFVALKAVMDPAQDEALIVGPSYPLYPKLCQMEGIACREVMLDPYQSFRPDAQRVIASLGPKTRVLVLASPSNPTGRVWPREELEILAAALSQREQPITVISDEVYRELYFGDAPPPSMAEFYPRTIVVNSLSKSNALTGLRLGWLMGPSEVMAGVLKVHQFAVSCASTYSQRVALEVFRLGRLGELREHYAAQREFLLERLDHEGLGAVLPEGGFYAMIRLTGPWAGDSTKAAFALLERKNVVAIPGGAFGAEGWLRISWVASHETLASGLSRIREFLALSPKV
ncbi:putative N-acetyl-LL-diaminopimelate aminotransferase [compost metagenome]